MIDLKTIRKEIESSSEDTRFAAWMTLYQDESKEALDELERIITTHDPILKVLFCRFLAHVPENMALLYLQRLLLDDNEIVVDNAIKAFEKNTGEDKVKRLLPILSAKTDKALYYAIEKLSEAGAIEAVEPILNMISNASEPLLEAILSSFRFFADRRTFFPTLKFIDDSRENIRFRAVMILGALYENGTKGARKYILDKLSDPSSKIRHAVIWILSHKAQKNNLSYFIKFSSDDPDALVRQESLIALSEFTTGAVISHIIKRLIVERDHHVVLKGESVLLNMPTKQLTRNLARLLDSQDQNIKNKVMVLYAHFQRDSTDYLHFLLHGLKAAHNDKARLPFIESIGVVQKTEAIPALEKYFGGSALVSYMSVAAVIKIADGKPVFSINDYLENPQLSATCKQIVLRFLAKHGDASWYDDELKQTLFKFIKCNNLNLRYLATLCLVSINNESILVPFFEAIIDESDPTTYRVLKENIVKLLSNNLALFLPLYQSCTGKDPAAILLFALLKEATVDLHEFRKILPQLLGEPCRMLDSDYKETFLTLLIPMLAKQFIRLDDLLNSLNDFNTEIQFCSLLINKLHRYPHIVLSLPLLHLETWNDKIDSNSVETLIRLLSLSDSPKAITFLVKLSNDPQWQTKQELVSLALDRIFSCARECDSKLSA